jgi:hypothetical protein
MTYRGKVQGGVVVLEGGARLPEGTEVRVEAQAPPGGEPPPSPESVWKKLERIATWAEGQPSELPVDLSSHHDHYLHGLNRRAPE